MFDSLQIANSGMNVYRTYLDASADNIANINTARPMDQDAFRARYVIAEATNYNGATAFEPGSGVRVAGVEFGNAEGRIVHDPSHPMADADGYLRMPDIDLGTEMTKMIMAQRGYQAQTASVKGAVDAYSAALEIGRR